MCRLSEVQNILNQGVPFLALVVFGVCVFYHWFLVFMSLLGLTYHFYFLIQLNAAKVIAVGPGDRDRDGKLIPVSLSEGDTILLPDYGGTKVKLAERVC